MNPAILGLIYVAATLGLLGLGVAAGWRLREAQVVELTHGTKTLAGVVADLRDTLQKEREAHAVLQRGGEREARAADALAAGGDDDARRARELLLDGAGGATPARSDTTS